MNLYYFELKANLQIDFKCRIYLLYKNNFTNNWKNHLYLYSAINIATII